AFEHPPDYLEGELVERSMPGTSHSRIQRRVVAATVVGGEPVGLYVYPEIHLPMATERWRIADLAFYAGEAESPYPKRVALGIAEILSPRDEHREILDRLNDYHAWGVPYIWLIDPERRTIHRYDGASLLAVDAIEFAEPAFRLTAEDLFKGSA
ncbi:MAG: Uma2 family endonuclease, partial [Bryobacteraceae bacterium]|nr:Uma2 family endonuclease [Bryobacteraceae bacterium]